MEVKVRPALSCRLVFGSGLLSPSFLLHKGRIIQMRISYFNGKIGLSPKKKEVPMSKDSIGRRDFMKSAAAGLGSFFLLSSNDPPKEPLLALLRPDKKNYPQRTLGKTGIRLPVITMGVMNSNNPNLVRAALDAGLVHLDTAQGYQRGTNEGMIGEVLKGRPRDSFVISTKLSLPRERTGLFKEDATEEAFLKKLDLSLQRLGLEYVDILHIHGLTKREAVLHEPLLKALEKAKKVGKTRFAGVSTHQNEPEVIHAAVDSRVYDVILTAYTFRQKHYAEVRGAIARAAQAGLGIIAMKTMGGNRTSYGVEQVDARPSLKWVLQDPHVHTIVAGFTTFDQLELDISIMADPALTRIEKSQLQKALSVAGLYCQGCGQCLGSCPQQLPIPELMRAYMYLYGYRNFTEAQDLVLSLDLPLKVCGDCETCPVACASGFDVSGRIRDVVRLREVPLEFFA